MKLLIAVMRSIFSFADAERDGKYPKACGTPGYTSTFVETLPDLSDWNHVCMYVVQ